MLQGSGKQQAVVSTERSHDAHSLELDLAILLHCIAPSLFSRAVIGKSLFDVAPRDIANMKLLATVMGGGFTPRDGISGLAIRRPDLSPLLK